MVHSNGTPLGPKSPRLLLCILQKTQLACVIIIFFFHYKLSNTVRLIPTNAAPRVHNDCASYRNEYRSIPAAEEVDLIASRRFFKISGTYRRLQP